MRGNEVSLPLNWREIAEHVNAEVNALPFKADVPGNDHWDALGVDTEADDCDGYAIGKLRRLLKAGFPIESLRLATCFVGGTGPHDRGEPHVVLVIDAPDDQYVLCNLHPELLTHPALVAGRYTRESIQKAGGSREWTEWKVA